jgi:hypothetical protein
MISVEERAARYLEKMEPAIQGQRGSDKAFKAACILTQGFSLDGSTSVDLLLQHFNPRCVPPWSEPELIHKVKNAEKLRGKKPEGYLLVKEDSYRSNLRCFQTPSREDCKEIAESRNLHGPGIMLAGRLGVVKVGDWHGQRVWGICDAGGPLAAIRRVDGKMLEGYREMAPRKTHCFSRAGDYHKPVGFQTGLQGCNSIALCEGLPDFLALWEQILRESSIQAQGGNPFNLGSLEAIKAKLQWIPLAMLAASARVEGPSRENFRGKQVRIFCHNEEAGRIAATRWKDEIQDIATDVDFYDCGEIVTTPGSDFNDCYQIETRRILNEQSN